MGGDGCTGAWVFGDCCCGGKTVAGTGEVVVEPFGGVVHGGGSCGGSLEDPACIGTAGQGFECLRFTLVEFKFTLENVKAT